MTWREDLEDAKGDSSGQIFEVPFGVIPTREMFLSEKESQEEDFSNIHTVMIEDGSVFKIDREADLHKFIIDSGASDSVGSPAACEAFATALRMKNPQARISVDRHKGQRVKFRMASGQTCCAHSLTTFETKFGNASVYVLKTEEASPLLLSVKALRALKAAICFETGTIACSGTSPDGSIFSLEKQLECSDRGHLLLDLTEDVQVINTVSQDIISLGRIRKPRARTDRA